MAFESIPGLADIATWGSAEEAQLARALLEAGQAHLFEKWAPGGADAAKKHAFFDQVRAVEKNYPGGCVAYAVNARELLRASAAGENPFAGMAPEVRARAPPFFLFFGGGDPICGHLRSCASTLTALRAASPVQMPELHRYDYGSPAFVAAERRGLAAVHQCAFVLVAGGLGERLGYTDIKVSLPVQSLTEQCYLELYIAQILTMQAKAGCAPLPLAIMTSDDTHARTAALLAAHKDFGAAPGQVTLIKQEKVPALLDNAARFALEEGDAYALETKPHGHGDVHTLLASSGLAAAWAAAGRRFVVFFQDTNALCFTVTIAALGVSAAHGLDLNSIAVPRKAKDAVGAITKLVRADGSSLTINVEYNQLEPMLKSSGFPEGDVNGADGYSQFPGNINQLIFALPNYVETLKRTGGLVPEFVNPKYADATKTRFKKPTRLECMMQVRAGVARRRRGAARAQANPALFHPLPPFAAGPAQGVPHDGQGGRVHV